MRDLLHYCPRLPHVRNLCPAHRPRHSNYTQLVHRERYRWRAILPAPNRRYPRRDLACPAPHGTRLAPGLAGGGRRPLVRGRIVCAAEQEPHGRISKKQQQQTHRSRGRRHTPGYASRLSTSRMIRCPRPCGSHKGPAIAANRLSRLNWASVSSAIRNALEGPECLSECPGHPRQQSRKPRCLPCGPSRAPRPSVRSRPTGYSRCFR
jgi:hypothetical protein